MPGRGVALRGQVRVRLIHDLALDAWTLQALADQYGVAKQSVDEFRQRHAYQIAVARETIEDQTSGLWIANKINRLAELEDDVNAINEALESLHDKDKPRLYLAKHRALRLAAEELGQLAPKKVDASVTVRYEIIGVDMAALE